MLLPKIKKQVLLLGFLALSVLQTYSQTAGDYRSIATGNWNAAATWQVFTTAWVAAASAPTAASGIITIQSPHVVTINAAVNNSASIIINTGGTLRVATTITLTNNAAGIITVNGTFSNLATGIIINNGAINNNATISNSGNFTNNLTLNNATGATITHTTGTFTNAATGTLTNAGTLTIAATKTLTNNGIISNSATINCGGANGTLAFGAGSFYRHNFTGASAGIVPAATWNATSTCEILGFGDGSVLPTAVTFPTNSFGHFIWNVAAQPADINLNSRLTTITGDFTVRNTNTKKLILKQTVAGSLNISGNMSIEPSGNLLLTNGDASLSGSIANISVVNYTQTGGTCILSGSTTGSGLQANATITTTGTTTISGGTLSLTTSSNGGGGGNGTFNAGSSFTLSGGTVNLSATSGVGTGLVGTLAITGAVTMSGGIINICSGTNSGGGGSGVMTVGGTMAVSAGTINVNSSSAVAASGVNGTLTVTGATTLSGTGVINVNSTTTTGIGGVGTFNANGGLTISGGTLTVNSSAAGSTTGATGTVTVTGNVSMTGGTINLASGSTIGGGGSGTMTVSGTYTQSAGALNLCSTTGAGTGNALLDIEGATAFSGTSTVNLNASTTTAGAGFGTTTINIAGNFSHTTTAASFIKTSASANSTVTINIDGALAAQTIISTNGFSGTPIVFNISQSGVAAAKCTIPAAQTFTVNSGTTFNLNDNALNTGYDLQVIGTIKNSGTINIKALATLDMLANAMTDATTGGGNFNLIGASTFITKHASGITALPSGTSTLGAIQVTGSRAYSATASYTYNGSANAQETGNGLPTALLSPSVLTINNTYYPSPLSSGGVTLSQATSTTGTLTLTSERLITTAANLMTIKAGAICGSGFMTTQANFSFVDGPIKKVGSTLFVFPTGDLYTASGGTATAKAASIEISATGTVTDEFIAEYHKINDASATSQVISSTNGPGIDHVSYKEYWDLNRAVGITVPTVKLYWADGSVGTSLGSAITSVLPANLRVAEYCDIGAGIKWNDKGSVITGTTASGTVTSNVANTFTTGTAMQFTFGTPSTTQPLPVELILFKGQPTQEGNQLVWKTASEINNDYFDLEHSVDGENFSTIAQVDGHGNSTAVIEYANLDKNPSEGVNYYRLKQVDFDGRFDYSSIVAIDNTNLGTNSSVLAYPNPSTENTITLALSNDIASITVFNMLGEIVYQQNNLINVDKTSLDILSSGVYVVKALTTANTIVTTKFTKN